MNLGKSVKFGSLGSRAGARKLKGVNRKIAIDLGTANCIVYVEGKGVVLKEPTVVAVSDEDEQIVAVGDTAREMLGKTPENITALKPMKNGVVADYDITEVLLRYFLDKVVGKSRFFKPDLVISIPAGATSVEARAVLDAAYSAGARNAYLVPEPLAAAIGADLPVSEPSGNMIVNIGGGTTEIAVVSLYGMVTSGCVRVGGMDLDAAIIQYIRRQYSLVIGENTAEAVKIDLGSATPENKIRQIEVKGRDAVSGFPKIVSVSSSEIIDCLEQPLSQISLAVKNVLEQTPPELSSDIVDKGIVLSGGTAQLKNLDKHIANYAGVPVHVADDPIMCVVKGLSIVLNDLQQFNKSMIKR